MTSVSFWVRGVLDAGLKTAQFLYEFSICCESPSLAPCYHKPTFLPCLSTCRHSGGIRRRPISENFSFKSPIKASTQTSIQHGTKIPWKSATRSLIQQRQIRLPIDAARVIVLRTGIEGYRVELEVFHQLSYLNLLKKAAISEHYKQIDESSRW